MIISRTPLRMSFVGGGSDLPSFYERFGGAVVSTTIDKYVYLTVSRKFDDAIRVSYSKTEEVSDVAMLEHGLVRETLRKVGIAGGVEITSVADIPSKGTGLGSSSAFTVGLVNALSAFQGKQLMARSLAEQACEIEIDRYGSPIGKQDQYSSAFGGLNFIGFGQDGTVTVEPIRPKPHTLQALEGGIVAFYTGRTRSAPDLLRRQSEAIAGSGPKQQAMRRMVSLAYELRDELQSDNLESFGEILHENWELKKGLLGGISDGEIDELYQRARAAGALGGKLLGAGAGGFLLFYATRDRHEEIASALSPLRRVRFKLEREGSKIIVVK